MAGNQNSGGDRPTAPQNNPANISATGGAGQMGTQAAKYIPGLPYGQGQATMQQQQAAPMAGPANAPTSELPPIVGLTAPTTRPNEPVTSGISLGAGPGPEALMLPNQTENQYKTARDAIEQMANDPDASPMMKYLALRVGQKF